MIRAVWVAGASLSLAACALNSREPVPGHAVPAPSVMAPLARGDVGGDMLMVDSAKAMLGQPYRWAGAAPGGFDCSGLVFYAAGAAGLRVPRTAAEQYGFGQPVKRADLRAGDLVFMHLARKQLHVAIAIDAEHFIHAPASGGFVRIDSLDSRPYSSGYLGARRILPARPAGVSSAPQQ